MSRRWAVVGGGLLGLTLALRLAGAGDQVIVFESAPDVGGLASAWQLGDVTWDRFYHVTLLSDTATTGLLDELGLASELRWSTTRTGCWTGGRLLDLSGPVDYLRAPFLGPVAKARLAATLGWGTVRRDGTALDTVPVERWLTRWSGPTAFERFWLPLLRSKVGEGWRDSSAAFIWATIQRLTAARRAGVGDERFGYVSGGYATTLRALGGRLAELGVEVRTASRVERVVRQGDGLIVTAAGSPASEERVDRVVVTAPPPVAAGLCPDLSEAERSRWAAVRYQGVTCTSVLLRRPLAGYYLTYLMDPAPFTTVVEMTSLIDPSEVGGHSLVYLPRYMASDDPEFGTADAAWEATALEGLRAVYPGVADDDVLAVRTARARMVFPLPVLGYARDVLPAATSVPGLHLVSSAQIVNGTLNANETIGLANRSAELLVAS